MLFSERDEIEFSIYRVDKQISSKTSTHFRNFPLYFRFAGQDGRKSCEQQLN